METTLIIVSTTLLLTMIFVIIYMKSQYNTLKTELDKLNGKKEKKVITYITDNDTGETTMIDPNSHISIHNCKVTVNNILTDMEKLKELQKVKKLEYDRDDLIEPDNPLYLRQVAREYEKYRSEFGL